MKKVTDYRRMSCTEFEEYYLLPKDDDRHWSVRFTGQNRARFGSDPRQGIVCLVVESGALNSLVGSPQKYAGAACDVADAVWNEMLARHYVSVEPSVDELDAMCREDFGRGLYEDNESKLGF